MASTTKLVPSCPVTIYFLLTLSKVRCSHESRDPPPRYTPHENSSVPGPQLGTIAPPRYTRHLPHPQEVHPDRTYQSPSRHLLAPSRYQDRSPRGYSSITTSYSPDVESQQPVRPDSDSDSEHWLTTLFKVIFFILFSPVILIGLVFYGFYNMLKWMYDHTAVFFWLAVIAFFVFEFAHM